MTKYAAFGTHIELGTAQEIRIDIVIDGPTFLLTGSGNADVTLTHAGMVGSGVAKSVALLITENVDTVATKIAAHFNGLSDVTDHMTVRVTGNHVFFRLLVAEADDATFQCAYADDTCAGLTDDPTAVDSVDAIAKVEVAAVKSIGGPALSVDTDDVTTHDSTAAWEEQVATVLRTGEVPLEIVYDPADNTHDATDTNGLAYRLKNRVFTYFDLMFMGGAMNWTFFGYVTGFTPGAPVGAHLSASVSLKITGQPTLE